MRITGHTSGFSLVEIALSLGVAAFALTAIFGLLSFGVNSGKESQEDTLLAMMANETICELRQQSFAVSPLPSAPQPTPPTLLGTATNDPSSTTLSIMYFDDSGARLRNSATNPDYASPALALQAGAVYQCTVRVIPDKSAAAVGGTFITTDTGQVNLVNVTLVFRWPVAGVGTGATPLSNPSQNGYRIIQTSLARY